METNRKAIPELRSLFISGRLWFDKSGGNTYHAVSISANGKWLFDIGMTYGYEDMYLYTALEYLKKFGLVSQEVRSLFDLRDTVDLYTAYRYTLKKELFEDSFKDKNYLPILAKNEALKNGEF